MEKVGSKRKVYEKPSLRRVELSLAEIAANTSCFTGVSGSLESGINTCPTNGGAACFVPT